MTKLGDLLRELDVDRAEDPPERVFIAAREAAAGIGPGETPRHEPRSRRWRRAAAASVFALVAVPSGFAIAQSVGSSDPAIPDKAPPPAVLPAHPQPGSGPSIISAQSNPKAKAVGRTGSRVDPRR